MIEDLQVLVEESFPASSDKNLIQGIREGIALADDLRQSEPLLMTPIGRDLAGHIRRAGVMWRLQDLCIRGELPFEAKIVKMPIGSWNHLEICAPNAMVAHLCKTDDELAFPDDTPNRQDQRLTNQGDLFEFENVVSLSRAIEQVSEKCVWLTYGCSPKGELSHVCWSMPSPPDDGEAWHARVNVMRRLQRQGEQPAQKPKMNPLEGVKFRKEIAEAISNDHDEKDQEK